MRADVSGGLNIAQDYSHGQGLDGAMDRSSRGTAVTSSNTISGNINRSGGNINFRGVPGTASGSSGDVNQNAYSQ
jgi:predicted transcriptional regulator